MTKDQEARYRGLFDVLVRWLLGEGADVAYAAQAAEKIAEDLVLGKPWKP